MEGSGELPPADQASGDDVPQLGILNIGKMKTQMDKFKIKSRQEMEKVIGMSEDTYIDKLVEQRRSMQSRGSVAMSEGSSSTRRPTSTVSSMGAATNPCCTSASMGSSPPTPRSPGGRGGGRLSTDSVDSSLLGDTEEPSEWRSKSIWDDVAHEDDPDPPPFMFCLTVCGKDRSHVNNRRSVVVMNFCLGVSCLSCIIMFGYIILGYMFYINDFSSRCRWTVAGCETSQDVANVATTT